MAEWKKLDFTYALCSMKWFENDPHLAFLAQQIKLPHKSVSAQEGQLQLCQSHNSIRDSAINPVRAQPITHH